MIIKQDKNAIKKNSISLLGGDAPKPAIQLATRHKGRADRRNARPAPSGGMSIQPTRPPIFLQEKAHMMNPIQGAYMKPPQFAPGGVFLDNEAMINPRAQHLRHGMLQGDTRSHRIVARPGAGELPIFQQLTPTAIERKAMLDQYVKRRQRTILPTPMPKKIIPRKGDKLPLFTIT